MDARKFFQQLYGGTYLPSKTKKATGKVDPSTQINWSFFVLVILAVLATVLKVAQVF